MQPDLESSLSQYSVAACQSNVTVLAYHITKILSYDTSPVLIAEVREAAVDYKTEVKSILSSNLLHRAFPSIS